MILRCSLLDYMKFSKFCIENVGGMHSIAFISIKKSGVMPSDSYILIRSSTVSFFYRFLVEVAIASILSLDPIYLLDSICRIVLTSSLCSSSSGIYLLKIINMHISNYLRVSCSNEVFPLSKVPFLKSLLDYIRH